MSKPTQKDRVLLHLMRAGSTGITQGDWLAFGGADGQGRITRLAARVEELRAIGMDIRTEGSRNGFSVYKLVPRAVEAASEPMPPQAPVGQLFELGFDEAVPVPRNAILDTDEAA